MPKARARLAPTTSMISEPTTARMICVCTTAGWRSRRAVAARPQREHGAEQRRQRQADRGREQLLLERVHHARKIDRPGLQVIWLRLIRKSA